MKVRKRLAWDDSPHSDSCPCQQCVQIREVTEELNDQIRQEAEQDELDLEEEYLHNLEKMR